MWIQIAVTALLVAVFPLSIVWVSKDENKYRKLIGVTLFLTFDLIVFGAFTRLTDSGLGCPDWPGCYGQANPFQAHHDIQAAQTLMPTGPVTVMKAWIEMIHRYLAMSVGILIFAQVAIAWRQRAQRRHSMRLPVFLAFFVCLQGAFGAWTVTLKLQPIIVTIHLLLGMCLLLLLTLTLAREQATNIVHPKTPPILKRLAPIAMAVLFMQLALGAWVSTNYASLACQDFPLCNGQWIPSLDFEHGFSLWRSLGMTTSGDYLPFSALVTMHWVHRWFAWFVVLMVSCLVYFARREMQLRKLANLIFAALIAQIALGIATVYFAWPLLLAVLHNAVAAVLVLLLGMINYRIQSHLPNTMAHSSNPI